MRDLIEKRIYKKREDFAQVIKQVNSGNILA
jgi:hypothetical protein